MNIVPSIEMIPAKYSPGILLCQEPTDGSGDLSVTRATTVSTRFNADGFIETVTSGLPRLDYYTSGGTAGCPALLVEPSATNFARGVERLNTPIPATAAGGITVTTGSTDFLAPDGSSGTITKYVGGTASGSNFLEYISSTSVTASGVHTFSAFVKAGATNPLNFCALQFTAFTAASGLTGTSYFSLASGTALTAGASIQDYGNGWYRIISAPYTIASGDLTGSIRLLFAEANNDASFQPSGALNLTLYAWGIQLEAGSVATSYIPTTTGSVTRDGDVIIKTGVSGLIGQTEGTIYAEVDISAFVTGKRLVELSNGSAANRMIISVQGSLIQFLVQNASSTQATIDSATLSAGRFKVAAAYASNDFVFYVNGAQAGVDVSGTVPTLNQINIGSTWNSILQFNDRILSAAIYKTRLPNYLLESATSQIESYSSLASSLSYSIV